VNGARDERPISLETPRRENRRSHSSDRALPAFASLALALGLSAPSSGLQAAERTIAPDIRVGGHIDDNARLREGDEGQIEISGGFIDLALLAQWRTPTSETQLRPRVRSARYPGDEDEDRDDLYLDFSTRSTGQRTQWILRGNYAKEEVIRGGNTRVDFADPDLDVPEDGETGRIDERRDRDLWRIAPSFSYELSERTDIGAGLNVQRRQLLAAAARRSAGLHRCARRGISYLPALADVPFPHHGLRFLVRGRREQQRNHQLRPARALRVGHHRGVRHLRGVGRAGE
jgi:hypothetical protein